ncbi:MAG: HNH endonuclease signature motif containing protein, partial [Bdellovibrionota bacterium]
NLSTLSMVQSTLKNHERTHKVEVSNEKKAEILQKVMGKSIDETQIILKKEFPEAPKREVLRSINGEDSRLSLNLESDVVTKLKRVRSLLSHKFPYANWSQIVTYLVEEYLKRKDPLTENAVTTNHRVKVQCTFRDEKTGRTCTSTYQLEDDHIIPRAIGGSDEPENFRFLCKQHNLYEAERILGPLGLNKRPTQ